MTLSCVVEEVVVYLGGAGGRGNYDQNKLYGILKEFITIFLKTLLEEWGNNSDSKVLAFLSFGLHNIQAHLYKYILYHRTFLNNIIIHGKSVFF